VSDSKPQDIHGISFENFVSFMLTREVIPAPDDVKPIVEAFSSCSNFHQSQTYGQPTWIIPVLPVSHSK
jgi:hypothetical protein